MTEFDFEKDSLSDDPLFGEKGESSPETEISRLLTIEEKTEESAEKLWMIPFADLMSTLVILFLALFGYAYLGSSSDYERAIAALQKELAGADKMDSVMKKEKEAEMAKAIEKYFDEEKLKDMAKVEMSAQYIRISLSNPVLFDAGRADLKTQAAKALEEIGLMLKNIPNAVLVEGHTDNVPLARSPYRSNFELSAARAFSVIEFFIKAGVDPSRFSAYGYGEFRPIADNTTEESKAKNRRIEINIVRTT
ncbi:MAG TPA: OmpA family protein [Elusimicrobiota bacterium]|nr:OmpA family protein [Elusimicrobiota bacterium]